VAGPPRRSQLLSIASDLLSRVVGSFAISTAWYFLVGLLFQIDALKDSTVVESLQFGGVVGAPLLTAVFFFVEQTRQAEARRASAQVDEAFERLQDAAPDKDVATISNTDVAASVKEAGIKVGEDHIARLVEQRKQELLIDDEYFRRELSHLIVDYLQPLPRNAKRVLNRFRINLLIAYERGLLTTDPKVSTQHIGKWLVLGERWPQLVRSLSTSPDKMKVLEGTVDQTSFMSQIAELAPHYVGDEDLRTFIQSKPELADVLPRLVHYGTEQSVPPNAQTVS
jgi:hypothetical protein